MNESGASENATFDTVPGVELANFALDKIFVQKYNARGLGYTLFLAIIVPLLVKLSESLGIYLVYLFALPQESLIRNYERYGFQRLSPLAEEKLHKRLKPKYDQSCIFMWQPLRQLAQGA